MKNLNRFYIMICREADAEHRQSVRQYAHVFHRTRQICVAKAFLDLPETFRMGILIHEVGHLMIGPKGSEKEADKAGGNAVGVKISRVNSIRYGHKLERIKQSDLKIAKRRLNLTIK